ncbi:MAG: HD domain-containing protein [Atopobiaceae bacterium]|nr:HD domain-containing protein [Atopobiaceae bacterium]
MAYSNNSTDATLIRAKRLTNAFVFVVGCVLLNLAGSQLVSALSLPIYLDCVGTMLAAIFGGYVPSVLVGYFTNLVNSIFDPSSTFYAVINVLIAIFATYFAQRGWFKSLPKAVASVFVFAMLGGGLASVLTWCLYGFDFGQGVTAPLVQLIHSSTPLPPMAAQLAGDFFLDVVDKALTVAIVIVLYHVLSHTVVAKIDLSPWQQSPLSNTQREEVGSSKSRIASVKAKFTIILSIIMIVLVVATTYLSYATFYDAAIMEQATYAQGITHMAANSIAANHVNEYLAYGHAAPGYDETEDDLRFIRDSFSEIKYLYAYRVEDDGCHVVFDLGTPDVPADPPGTVVELDPDMMPYHDKLIAGVPVDHVVSYSEYGWLLTLYTPLYDSNHRCVCYVIADIRMEHIVNDGYAFMARIIALFGALFILACTIVLWLAEYGIILPLNSIAYTMSGFAYGEQGHRDASVRQIKALDVRTGDEIENLYHSLTKTAEDTVRFITESEEKTQTIARMQENLIMVMADLVESRDKFTGDHIRKTAAYAAIVMEQMKKEGIYADQLTDKFVSDVVHSAPLHDIGKILVSDTILNKPGRLTADEFKIMQSHTTAGREIIERAAAAVSEPTYLDEAKRLAEFHHEKWDGSGYPTGRSGEDIPLSGRIMAVADVFDALVSKRSYKVGFPLDKAFSIIEEGMGSHFDPQIATAFLHARPEVERIAREHGDVVDPPKNVSEG